MAIGAGDQVSPWRRIFEEVRRTTGSRRDEHGALGSINWLRKHMELRGANPNVVRNIIYRDKGRLADKRVLFEILDELWRDTGEGALRAPEIEVLLSRASSAEQEVLHLLGREKLRAYRSFVGGARGGGFPKLLVTGGPGSGKTLLIDYVQRALEALPKAADLVFRHEFVSGDLSNGLGRLGAAVGVPTGVMESRVARIATSSAFAVQADAQADVARAIIAAARSSGRSLALLLHVSQSNGGVDLLAGTPLRLNTREVPRANASEWLWLTLFEPLSRLDSLSLLVSTAELPARAASALGAFEGPLRLKPPTAGEARRFVRGRLPHLSASEQESLVRRAGRSFEDLRTLTLLAEAREPLTEGDDEGGARHIARLVALADTSVDERLRDFLASLAVLSVPEYPTFAGGALDYLRGSGERLGSLEAAFLDPLPARRSHYRAFSRQLGRSLRQRLASGDPGRYRTLNRRAASWYEERARCEPRGEHAGRYLHHLLEARDWQALEEWLARHGARQHQIVRIWQAATDELEPGSLLEGIARHVAAHYVGLGSYEHPEAEQAFTVLAASARPEPRVWTLIRRAEGAALQGRFEAAEALLGSLPPTDDPVHRAEAALVRASIARWRSRLGEAVAQVEEQARPCLVRTDPSNPLARQLQAKVAVWAGFIAKDRGDLETALREFETVLPSEDLGGARVSFHRGDVLLRLGRYDAALEALDRAAELARRSEALAREQTRYLARRGSLHARRGDLAEARRDFTAAWSILEGEEGEHRRADHGFWLARLEGERAMFLLVEERFEEAVVSLVASRRRLRQYAEAHGLDASYQLRRNTLRLARAYLAKALGRPERLPCLRRTESGRPTDLLQARRLLATAATAAPTHGTAADPLAGETLLLSSMAAPDAHDAISSAVTALAAARFPYGRAECLSHLAAALLRSDDPEAALARTREAEAQLELLRRPGERGDLALASWLCALGLRAQLRLGDVGLAALRLETGLQAGEQDTRKEALLRAFGEELERTGQPIPKTPTLAALLERPEDLDPAAVRLPDALVARWRELRGPSVAAAGS